MTTNTITPPVSAISLNEKKLREKAAKALANARQRCTNPKNKDYPNYGGQGVQVLLSLDELIAAISLPPQGASLDRIDPNGHYEVGNVRWATKAVQAANKKASPAGSVPPLSTLIAQQKVIVQQEQIRPKIAEAWQLLLHAFNRGTLPAHYSARLAELLDLNNSPHELFRSRQQTVGGNQQTIFRLPSLTLPNGIVDARGPLTCAPDAQCAKRFMRHGLIFGLRDLNSSGNVPVLVRNAITQLLSTEDRPGMTMVGRPAEDDLLSGWFEVWMLAAASRLPLFDVRTAFFPAMACLNLLKEFGSTSNWDEIEHPLLDARLLFIPDFQLDCGPWGNLGPYQFAMLERLLRYRIEAEHRTIVGVQAPHKLTPPLQKILLASFRVKQVPNGTSPPLM